jgi:MFS family permease
VAGLRRIGRSLFPNPGFYGWTIAGVGFLCCALSSPGQSFAISLYLEHVMADLGISRLEISTLYAVATLAAAACLPVVGGISDRLSGRAFLAPVVALLGGAILLFAAVQSVAALALAFFALRLLGQGAIGLGTLTVTVRWFRRYRGRSLAVVALGYAFGELVFPGAIYGLIGVAGWRGSLVAIGGAYLLLFAPLTARLLRERAPDEAMDGEPRPLHGSHAVVHPERSATLREALSTGTFWGLLACVAVQPMVITAVVIHQVAIFTDRGWGAGWVPPAFMAYALASVGMTYATGLLLERIPSRFGISIAMAFTVLALASVALPLPAAAGALAYGTLLGLAAGGIAAANSMVWPDYFGIDALGAIKGVVNAVRNGATAVGPPLAAVLMTVDGSFGPALLVFAVLSALAALGALAMRPATPAGGDREDLRRAA